MAEEANGRVLVRETGGGSEFVENVTPALRSIEGGVNNREACDHPNVFQLTQPLSIFGGELPAGPIDCLSGSGIKAIQRLVGRAVFVVISLDHWDVHVADDIEAFLGAGIISDDIAEAGKMGAFLLFDILQNN